MRLHKKLPKMKKAFVMKKPKLDMGFYGHLTHESMQSNEDSVCTIGDGFGDSYLPKVPKTDKYTKTNLK